jgi:hypothetical protein
MAQHQHQHQHHQSISGRYPPGSDPRDPRRSEPVPPPGQPGYSRYPGAGPAAQARDAGPGPGSGRSYTPVNSSYTDTRGSAQGPTYGGQEQIREMVRDPREMGRDPRDPRETPQQSILPRQLRPHEDFGRPPSERYR